jgi:mitochondrial intermediate peptidase
MTFLDSLAKANLPAAQKELTDLANLRSSLGHHKPLQAWDRDYYTQKLHQSRRGQSRNSEMISDYFSLGTVMQGLNRLFSRLYGLRLVPRATLPGEVWNDDVRRLDVISDTDGHVAVLYCDLFERNGKSPNPAHFTIRCSRKIQDVELSEKDDITSDGMAYGRRDDGTLYQLPTITLICDFSRGAYSRPTLLSFREVQTLFHEMGHALHSIVGRTELHNVAGTRCATDFAELPSVLMEYFAKAPQVLALYARHYETDEPLPIQLLEENLKAHATFESIETRTQIILAILDQKYHSNLPATPGFNSTDVYHDVLKSYDVFPSVKTSWQGFFGHLFGYGALYYSYLFDQAIAAKVWKDVFETDPVDRDRGELWKNEVLRFGGGRDPWHSVARALKMDKLADGGVEAMKEVGTWGRELK